SMACAGSLPGLGRCRSQGGRSRLRYAAEHATARRHVVDRSPRPDGVCPLPPHARPGLRAIALLLAAVAGAGALACRSAGPAPLAAQPGSARGRLVAPRGARAAAREPMLVFLEPLDAQPGTVAASPAVLRSTDRGFEPPILAASAGHAV